MTLQNQLFSFACEFGFHSAVVWMMERGVEPTSYGLHLAARSGHVEIVRMLLDDGRAYPTEGILRSACYRNHVDIVRMLLDDPRVVVDVNDWYLFSSNAEIVRMLLEDGRADPSLYAPCKNGDVDTVRLLIEDGRADPSLGFSTACYRDHDEIIHLLFHDPRTNISRGLNSACERRNFSLVTLIMKDPRFDPTAYGTHSAINDACGSGDATILRILLEDGRLIPEKRDMRCACWYGGAEVTRLLLADGRVDPDEEMLQKAKDDETAIALLRDGRVSPWSAPRTGVVNAFLYASYACLDAVSEKVNEDIAREVLEYIRQPVKI